jgi:hypothetical protein
MAATAELVAAMEKLGIRLVLARGLCTLTVRVDIRDDLLEYVLVNPRARRTRACSSPRSRRARSTPRCSRSACNRRERAHRAPRSSADDRRAARRRRAVHGLGAHRRRLLPLRPRGAARTRRTSTRVEDLVRNLENRAQHAAPPLGVPRLEDRAGQEEPREGPLRRGGRGQPDQPRVVRGRLHAADERAPECIKQSIWLPNSWILPERGEPLELVFSREKLVRLPEDIEARLPRAQVGERR